MNDERHDDEILGRALARAIETQQVRETPFERSRVAVRPARRGFPVWQALGAAAVLVLALAFGAWFTRPPDQTPVAASPTPAESTKPTNTPAATVTPAPTPKTAPNHDVVYVARDGLPPVGVELRPGIITGSTAEQRIQQRLGVLLETADLSTVASEPVGGATTNVLSSASGSKHVSAVAKVTISGDVAIADLVVTANGWGVSGAAATTAALQQLVYTATEEPGIRRLMVTENGGRPARIDQIVFDKPMSREDVFGYGQAGGTDTVAGDFGGAGGGTSGATWSVDSFAPGLTRFVVTVSDPAGKLPAFDVAVNPTENTGNPSSGKVAISLLVASKDTQTPTSIVDRTPLRAVGVANGKFATGEDGVLYVLQLDDLRPWRVYTLANPTRIVLDIGGTPQAISDRIAVYAPTAGATIARTFTLSGAARVFEANVVWRVKDGRQNVVAEGNTTASLGTSALWGTFDTQVTLPANVTGNATLEVYEVSAKDGSEQGVVAIPLTVR